MTLFISVRSSDVGGPVTPAFVVEAKSAPSPAYTPVPDLRLAQLVAGKDVIVAVHGFNVSRPKAVRSYAALEAALALTEDQIFFGVLWPGDAWIPVINYPSEAGDAVKGRGHVADFLNRRMTGAASFAFISHSLGGRLLLEAVQRLNLPVREVCVTAGAVDDDCLTSQYAPAKIKAGRVSVLASKSDRVLQLAYPLGDFASDLFWRDHDSPWRGALGRSGPHPTEARPPVFHRQIPTDKKYGHGDYFPPSDGAGGTRWPASVQYMRRAINGLPDSW
jgi:esterase/lipase superfamily enzyme